MPSRVVPSTSSKQYTLLHPSKLLANMRIWCHQQKNGFWFTVTHFGDWVKNENDLTQRAIHGVCSASYTGGNVGLATMTHQIGEPTLRMPDGTSVTLWELVWTVDHPTDWTDDDLVRTDMEL